MVALRASKSVFAAALTLTVPFSVPELGLTVTQGESELTVHDPFEIIVRLWVPPSTVYVMDDGETLRVGSSFSVQAKSIAKTANIEKSLIGFILGTNSDDSQS